MKNITINVLYLLICLMCSSVELNITPNEQYVELNALIYSMDSGVDTFKYYIESFNEYSKIII